ncbi:MAG: lectin-like protein, partial [Candidatus Poribacteria bacterium]|nr:lectin-like protein [Candidatus Poribacteria bacterium]
EQIGFSVKPGTHIENVEVTVQPRMRIRGRIVFKDGTPLASARAHLRFRSKTVDGSGNRQSGGEPRTDAEGYFVYYLDEKDDPAFYTFSVEYQDISAEAGPIRINPGERLDGLTLTFDSEPIALQPPSHIAPQPPSDIVPQALPHTKTLDRPSAATPPRPRRSMPMSKEVWIVNPENLHAYKGIYCETRDDAIARAREENAHLVTINDAAEQTWLAKVFERKFYWIGLSRVSPVGASSEATQWRWESGEPITYANWLPDYIFGESLDVSERVYAVMAFTDGKWYAVGPDSLVWRMTEMAILEKANVLDNPSAAEK